MCILGGKKSQFFQKFWVRTKSMILMYICVTFLKTLHFFFQKSLIPLFHSMLAAYNVKGLCNLGPDTLWKPRNKITWFCQHCIAGWKFSFFRQRPTKSLTRCSVECQATVSALVSEDLHSKERITLYFFDVKDLLHM